MKSKAKKFYFVRYGNCRGDSFRNQKQLTEQKLLDIAKLHDDGADDGYDIVNDIFYDVNGTATSYAKRVINAIRKNKVIGDMREEYSYAFATTKKKAKDKVAAIEMKANYGGDW